MAIKYDYKYLTEYCNQHNITLTKDYSKYKITRNIDIDAKCIYENCLENITKNFRQLCKTGCYCKTHTEILCVEKRKKTCFKNYGVEHPSQSEKIKDKKKQTFIEHYGVENPMQNKEVREKGKQTCLIKFGVEYPNQNKEVREKVKQTCLLNHNVDYPLQSAEVREKSKKTCLKHFGVEHPNQNPEIAEKASKNSYLTKT